MDQADKEQDIVLIFHSFDVIVPKAMASASSDSPAVPIIGRTLIFYEVPAVLSMMEWFPWPLLVDPTYDASLVVDEHGEETLSVMGYFLPNLPLVPLRHKRRKKNKYIALTYFEESTAQFSLLLAGSDPDPVRVKEELKELVSVTTKR